MAKLKTQNTYKHLVGFCAKSETRPILTGINTNDNGDLTATNTHILLRLFNRLENPTPMTIQPKELRIIEGDYPNVDRLIKTNFNSVLAIKSRTCGSIFRFLKSVDKKVVLDVSVQDEQLQIRTEDVTQCFKVDGKHVRGSISFNCNPAYLLQICNFISDTVPAEGGVMIGFDSSNRPVHFFVLSIFHVILTPIRNGG